MTSIWKILLPIAILAVAASTLTGEKTAPVKPPACRENRPKNLNRGPTSVWSVMATPTFGTERSCGCT